MIRVGYFATGGHTEVGGLQAFLDRIDPRAVMLRCFPAVQKPGPKIGRVVPMAADEGITGGDLVSRMLRRLERYHRPGAREPLDIVLLIDDADCRFADGESALDGRKLEDWLLTTTQRVCEAAQSADLPFVALLGSPEIEAWFLADWEQGFGRQYARLQNLDKPLRAYVAGELGHPLDEIEAFGHRLVNGSCEQKLSERIAEVLAAIEATYRKSVEGAEMLRRVRPDRIAEGCATCYRPAWQALLRAIDSAAATEDAAGH